MALFSTLALIGLGLGVGGLAATAAAGGFNRPQLPAIPPPRRPPPPTAQRPAPPRRRDPQVQQAGAEIRGLFRRRGRQTTVLTPGRGAGVAGNVAGSTRSLLGETAR